MWFSVAPLCLCGESFLSNFTTETQSIAEFAQRNAFSDSLLQGGFIRLLERYDVMKMIGLKAL